MLKDHIEPSPSNKKEVAICPSGKDEDCPPQGEGFEKGCINKVCMRWKTPEASPYARG